ncbi:MAG: hypothetical protein R3B70_29570 [Polyangiaceae bacterium]
MSQDAAVAWAAPWAGATVVAAGREVVTGDIAHYTILLDVGDGPNARLLLHRIVRERAPFQPRKTAHALMLLHGDFSTFTASFAPPASGGHEGMAVHLAERDIDVWGVDRRWTSAPEGSADLSDFPAMGFSQAISDTGLALRFARAVRVFSGGGHDKLFLGGFSRGGHIAYSYAALEAEKPAHERLIKGLVPIDVYAAIAPEDDALRQGACARRDEERAQLEAGTADSDNTFFSLAGALAIEAPEDPSPLFEGYTNRGVVLALVGQTYFFFTPTPLYHLAGGVVSEGEITGLRYSPEPAIQSWLAAARPHQALAEIADGDALWCGEGPRPEAGDLGAIEVPVFYLGAAGGFGDHGLYTLTLLGSAACRSSRFMLRATRVAATRTHPASGPRPWYSAIRGARSPSPTRSRIRNLCLTSSTNSGALSTLRIAPSARASISSSIARSAARSPRAAPNASSTSSTCSASAPPAARNARA